MHTIKTVFLNESEEPLEKGGPAINIKYPLVPVPGDRLNFDDLNETSINDYIKKTGTSTFIVFSRHLFYLLRNLRDFCCSLSHFTNCIR